MHKIIIFVSILLFPAITWAAVPIPTIPLDQLKTSYSWPKGDDNERLKSALTVEGIPFRTYNDEAGREWIEWTRNYDKQIDEIQARLFGEIPSGTHSIMLSSDKEKHSFIDWLNSEDIPFSIILFHGDEYVVWDTQYSERVIKHEFVPDALLEW